MITLYKAPGGASTFSVEIPAMPPPDFAKLKHNVIRLLQERGKSEALIQLQRYPFGIFSSFNDFLDDFCVLHATVPVAEYEQCRQISLSAASNSFADIAQTFTELGTYVRFVAVSLKMESPTGVGASAGLTDGQIHRLVNKYIGVAGGYLGDFSYASHREFYMELDLPISPDEILGTTRERFMKILKQSDPPTQAKIVLGILRRYPEGSSEIRTQAIHDEIASWIKVLKSAGGVAHPTLIATSAVVEHALRDAEQLIAGNGPVSGVDRLHTALHGYAKHLCEEAGILPQEKDPDLTRLFKQLKENHPKFQSRGARDADVSAILNALTAIVSVLNPIRNRASIAHPNDLLLEAAEAQLVINAVRSLLHYLEAKLA